MGKKREKADPKRGHIDAIADRVAITDLQGKILDVNQAMLDFRGRRREEIIGRNFLDLVAAPVLGWPRPSASLKITEESSRFRVKKAAAARSMSTCRRRRRPWKRAWSWPTISSAARKPFC
jgi:PAS domain S-box-containing protein